MSDIPRLLDDPATSDLAKQLLSAGRAEAVPAKRIAAMAAGITKGGVAVASGSAALATKVFAIVAAVTVVGGGGYWMMQKNRSSEVAEVKVSAPAAAAPVSIVTPAPAPVSIVTPAPAPVSIVAPAPVAVPAVLSPDDLNAEIAIIDAANQALRDDNFAVATSSVAAYRKRFAKGSLRAEAAAIEFEVARRSGKVERARVLGAKFLQMFPSSPISRRIETRLLDMSENQTPPSDQP
jgi:hypothetical protein